MCQEIQLSDVRLALLDYCEEHGEDEHCLPDDLLAQFDDPWEDRLAHAVSHRRRARQLASVSDDGAAEIHQALYANMARAAGGQSADTN